MSQTLHIVLFWLAVIAAIRVAVWFPDSLPARVLFSPQGPVRGRGETESDFLRRRARFHGGWLAQAAALFAAGWIAKRLDASLEDSLAFVVMWAAVLPALAACALVAALADVGRALLFRRRESSRAPAGGAHGAEV